MKWTLTAILNRNNTNKGDKPIMQVQVTENEGRNGVELRFAEKPGEDVRARLKGVGFRWHRAGRFWYARRCLATLGLAEELRDGCGPMSEAA